MLKRILGLVGWLGVALVLAALAISRLRPEWRSWYVGLAIAGLICVLLYILSEWREFARAFSGREAKFGTIAVTSTLVVLAILVALNYLAARHNKRWDLTAGQQFTLSDQTRRILQDLERPVSIKVFSQPDDFERFRDRLDQYDYVSPQLSVEYIDAVKNPSRANQYQVQALGTVVLEYDGRTERVTTDGEQDITNALIKLIQGRQHKVYFVQGHGEKSPTDSDRLGYSGIASALGTENYTVEPLVLAQQKEIPEDASVLVVAGPQTGFFAPEIEMLKRYMGRGGKVLFMLDPPAKPDGSAELPEIMALLKEWGVEAGSNVVVDVSGMGQLLGTGPEVPIAARYPPHPITERFNLITAYRLARSVSPIEGSASGRFPQTLVETSAASWAESDIKALNTSGQVSRDVENGDKAGPISLAVAVSAPATDVPKAAEAKPVDPAKPEGGQQAEAAKEQPPAPETRLVVFGDSDFVANAFLNVPGNRDLFMNTISWLAQQENLISIRPRDPEDRRVTLTANQQNWIFWMTVLVIPALVLFAGVLSWSRRR